jgi:predicted nucleic acid-binding protein
MRVYVESNFVLELVLEQEQHLACAEIVRLAEAGTIELVIPAFGLLEPYMTLHRRHREQEAASRTIQKHLRQLVRTASVASSSVAASSNLEELFGSSSRNARRRYEEVRACLARIAVVLPLTDGSLRAAEKLRAQHNLELPDATILATILYDLSHGGLKPCFLNRNTNDFSKPPIVDFLAEHGCKLLGSFDDGLAYMRQRIAATPG